MNREHAPAVRELAAKVQDQFTDSGSLTQELRSIENTIAEALAPLLEKAQECCIGIVTQGEMRDLRIELARWEPPKTEGK